MLFESIINEQSGENSAPLTRTNRLSNSLNSSVDAGDIELDDEVIIDVVENDDDDTNEDATNMIDENNI